MVLKVPTSIWIMECCCDLGYVSNCVSKHLSYSLPCSLLEPLLLMSIRHTHLVTSGIQFFRKNFNNRESVSWESFYGSSDYMEPNRKCPEHVA